MTEDFPLVTGDRIRVVLAFGCMVVAIVSCAGALLLRWQIPAQNTLLPLPTADFVLALAWPVTGLMILRRRPRNRVGWLLMTPATLGPYELAGHYAAFAHYQDGETLPGAGFAAWIGAWGFVAYFYVVPLLPLLFPDGRAPSERWRPMVRMFIVAATASALFRMFSPIGIDVDQTIPNPLGIESAPWIEWIFLANVQICMYLGSAVGAVALVQRTRRATGQERAQLQWLQFAGLMMFVLLLIRTFFNLQLDHVSFVLADLILSVALAGPALGIAVAMLRYRLFDIELLLNRSAVYVCLTALVLAVYGGFVLAAQSFTGSSVAGTMAIAVAALLAASIRNLVQRMVDRLLYGHRHDPYAVLSRVGRHMAPAAEPLDALQRLVEQLREALNLPYVAFHGTGTHAGLTVSSGRLTAAGCHTIQAQALGQTLGELQVGLRSRRDSLRNTEEAAVSEVATRAATLTYAISLVDDVARSRARLVMAREDERRRLHADIHDGVGPALAGTAHLLDALAHRIDQSSDPGLATRALEIRDRIRTITSDIRSVVHGLRPPVLDQVGLTAALRGLVNDYETPRCTTEIADFGEMPAAVESAAYAIAAEATTNAVRHSAGSELHLRACLEDDVLVLEIRDNGRGVPDRPRLGIGLRSMGERAAEVGGRLDIRDAPDRGTVVQARLPMEAP